MTKSRAQLVRETETSLTNYGQTREAVAEHRARLIRMSSESKDNLQIQTCCHSQVIRAAHQPRLPRKEQGTCAASQNPQKQQRALYNSDSFDTDLGDDGTSVSCSSKRDYTYREWPEGTEPVIVRMKADLNIAYPHTADLDAVATRLGWRLGADRRALGSEGAGTSRSPIVRFLHLDTAIIGGACRTFQLRTTRQDRTSTKSGR